MPKTLLFTSALAGILLAACIIVLACPEEFAHLSHANGLRLCALAALVAVCFGGACASEDRAERTQDQAPANTRPPRPGRI